MRTFRDVLLWIWQLPQNLAGLASLRIFKCWRMRDYCGHPSRFRFYATDRYFGVSLGMYVIVDARYYDRGDWRVIRHEHGHQKQSLYLGPLYLPVIGLPSFLYNKWDELFHKGWGWKEREKWYYTKFGEAWADKLGGVKRF